MYRDDFPEALAARWKVSRYAPDEDAIANAAAEEIGLDWGLIGWASEWQSGTVQIGSWVARIANRLGAEIVRVVRAGKQDDYGVGRIADYLLAGLSPGQHFDLLIALNVDPLPARDEVSSGEAAARTIDFTRIELMRRLNKLLRDFESDGLLLSAKERRREGSKRRRYDRRTA